MVTSCPLGIWYLGLLRLIRWLNTGIGRCSFDANSRTIDVRKVVWIATSNIGHEAVPRYCRERENPEVSLSRDEYVKLMDDLRPQVLDGLGVRVKSIGGTLR